MSHEDTNLSPSEKAKAGSKSSDCPVLDFDHRNFDYQSRFTAWKGLRDLGPIFWSEHYDGFWVVAGHEQVLSVLHDPETFSSARTKDGKGGQSIPPFMWPRPNIPGEYDGEAHHHYRRGFMQAFSPKAMQERRLVVEGIVAQVFDGLQGRQTIDAALELAVIIPARAILSVMGADVSDAEWMGLTGAEILVARGGSPRMDELQRELRKMEERMLEQAEDRRRQPRDDLMTEFALMKDHEGNPLGRDDLLGIFVNSFLFGGLVTAAEVIANAVFYLAQHNDLRKRLAADPGLIPGFAEDMTRYVTPATSTARTVSKDTVLGGQQLKAGDRVLVFLSSANMDERSFPEPETVEPSRGRSKHVGFGHGAHTCPGAPLARVEIELTIRELLRRMPHYSLVDAPAAELGLAKASGRWEPLMIHTGW